ncbi:hypothetical protein KIPB_007702 [Kipferlia bialata]|uniref:Uncharacterized protein n=1 Tax=Kipferlia bialata TaxID=797122 RepID=A0A9K3D1A9_9EUKA|nr:hypothetical protein KIPB_007702 [Kipferlia bialata]|eukprot:g7702.t1
MPCSRCCSITGLVLTTLLLVGVGVGTLFLFWGWDEEVYMVDMLEDGQEAEGMVTAKIVEQRVPVVDEDCGCDTSDNTLPGDMDSEHDMDEEWLGYRCVVTVSFGAEEYNLCDSEGCRYWAEEEEARAFCDEYTVGTPADFTFIDHTECERDNGMLGQCAFTEEQVDDYIAYESEALTWMLVCGIGGTVVCLVSCLCLCSCLKKTKKTAATVKPETSDSVPIQTPPQVLPVQQPQRQPVPQAQVVYVQAPQGQTVDSLYAQPGMQPVPQVNQFQAPV